MKPILLYSAETLQKWDRSTPWKTGIGGSETAHIELYQNLPEDVIVKSFMPLDVNSPSSDYNCFPSQLIEHKDFTETPHIVVNYRDNTLYDKVKFHPKTKHYFIAQDVDYAWTPEQLSNVNRYITLCEDHTRYTLNKYPELRGKVYQSSNGVRSQMIKYYWENRFNNSIKPRNKNQVIYASSPDRGLLCLLENFWRIREAVPDAILKVAYGFENTDKIISMLGGSAYHEGFKAKIEPLLSQPGVEWLGRIPQDILYEHWFESSVWAYPCNFAETSCITCLDAQACGAVPVTNDLWALRDNVKSGIIIPGIPQSDKTLKHKFIQGVIDVLNSDISETERKTQIADPILENYSWKNITHQFYDWFKEDSND